MATLVSTTEKTGVVGATSHGAQYEQPKSIAGFSRVPRPRGADATSALRVKENRNPNAELHSSTQGSRTVSARKPDLILAIQRPPTD